METHIQIIELINDYLNKLLSDEASSKFETRLQTDQDFSVIFKEHLLFLKGLNRIEIKEDIIQAKRSYKMQKWLKIFAVSILTISVLIALLNQIFKVSEVPNTPENNVLNTISMDTISVESSKAESINTTSMEKDSIPLKKRLQDAVSEEATSIVSVFKPILKDFQNITINTQKDTTIKCKEGTILKITKNSFQNPETGKTITGLIDLKVSEYYKLSDILLANLSTASNGKQLETGGMLYIEAAQDDMNLKLNEGKSLQISFPTKIKKSGMQLFSGNREGGQINWKPLHKSNDSQIHSESNELVSVSFETVEQVPTFPGCEAQDNEQRKKCTVEAIQKFIQQKFNTSVGYNLNLTGKQRINCFFRINQDGSITDILSTSVHQELSDEADRVIAQLPQMIPAKHRGNNVIVPYSLPIVFTLESDDELTQRFTSPNRVDTMRVDFRQNFSNIELDTVYTEVRGVAETIKQVMHDADFKVDSSFIKKWNQYKEQRLIRALGMDDNTRYILRKTLFEIEPTRFKILEDDSITRGGNVIRIPWDKSKVPGTLKMILRPKRLFSAGQAALSAEEFESQLNSKTDSIISSRNVNYYVLNSTELGWINCDRFLNGRIKRIKYKLKVKNADGATISMIFKAYNSVLPSYATKESYDFQTVEDNQDIILFAIKRKDGKLFYDTIETQTAVNPKMEFYFKEVNINELKKVLDDIEMGF